MNVITDPTPTPKAITIAIMFLLVLAAGPAAAAANNETNSKTILASRIIDGEVYNAEAQPIGEVDDLVLRRGGRVKKLTVEFGGFLGLGDKLVALPFSTFDLKKDGRMTLAVTKTQLEKKKAFNYHDEGLQPDYLYRPRPPYAGPYRFPWQSMYYGPHGPNPELGPYAWARSPSKFLASSVMDRRLIDESGELLGMVVDLVIDRKTMKVSRIVIATDALTGDSQRLNLPYDSLGFTAFGLVYHIVPPELKSNRRQGG